MITLVTGPAGAGKTTAADILARSGELPCAHISLDDVRCWVKNGYANPQDGWTDEAERQHLSAQRSIADAALRLDGDGFNVVIDDAFLPAWPNGGLLGWARLLAGPPLHLVVLYPEIDVVQVRNEERAGERRLTPSMAALIHDAMRQWIDTGAYVLDNSALSPAQTAALIAEEIERGRCRVTATVLAAAKGQGDAT